MGSGWSKHIKKLNATQSEMTGSNKINVNK